MTCVLPSLAFGRWGLAVPSRREPSKLNHLHPLPRRETADRYAGIGRSRSREGGSPAWGHFFPWSLAPALERPLGVPLLPRPPEVPPPRLRGPGSSGYQGLHVGHPRSGGSGPGLQPPGPSRVRGPRLHPESLHVHSSARPPVIDEETARRGSEGGPGHQEDQAELGPWSQTPLAPADHVPKPSCPAPQARAGRVSSMPRALGVSRGQPQCPHLDLVGKGQGHTPRSRRFFWF